MKIAIDRMERHPFFKTRNNKDKAMKPIDRDIIRDAVYAALKKVMDTYCDTSNFPHLRTESTEVHMTNAVMIVLDTIADCDDSWEEDGFLGK